MLKIPEPVKACPPECTFDWPAFHKQLDIALAHAIDEQNMLPSQTTLMEFLTYSYSKVQALHRGSHD